VWVGGEGGEGNVYYVYTGGAKKKCIHILRDVICVLRVYIFFWHPLYNDRCALMLHGRQIVNAGQIIEGIQRTSHAKKKSSNNTI
jgi:hypothetical protein